MRLRSSGRSCGGRSRNYFKFMLNSPAITELSTEAAALNLLAEWLGNWFNGQANAVGGNAPVTFPLVNIAFNQSQVVQPLTPPGATVDTTIRIIILPRMETTESLDTILGAGKLATARVLVNFYVLSKRPKEADANQSAQTVASLLKAILTNPTSTADLGAKGLRMLHPETPRVIQSVDYAQRLVACGAQILYPILFGDQPAVSVN